MKKIFQSLSCSKPAFSPRASAVYDLENAQRDEEDMVGMSSASDASSMASRDSSDSETENTAGQQVPGVAANGLTVEGKGIEPGVGMTIGSTVHNRAQTRTEYSKYVSRRNAPLLIRGHDQPHDGAVQGATTLDAKGRIVLNRTIDWTQQVVETTDRLDKSLQQMFDTPADDPNTKWKGKGKMPAHHQPPSIESLIIAESFDVHKRQRTANADAGVNTTTNTDTDTNGDATESKLNEGESDLAGHDEGDSVVDMSVQMISDSEDGEMAESCEHSDSAMDIIDASGPKAHTGDANDGDVEGEQEEQEEAEEYTDNEDDQFTEDEDDHDHCLAFEEDYKWQMDKSSQLPGFDFQSTQSLDATAIRSAQEETVSHMATLLGVHETTAMQLLRFFKWDAESLTDKYFEDRASLMKAANVDEYADEDVTIAAATDTTRSPDETFCCPVCCDDVPLNEVHSLQCGHRFCGDCWGGHLSIGIQEGKALDLACMWPKCSSVATEDFVRKFVAEDVFTKYTSFVANMFVNENRHVKWCPAPGCGRAVHCANVGMVGVQCECGYRFCFRCNGEAHVPASCEMIKKWEVKCHDDSETANWIVANTKYCPKCQSTIEKNGGCNHMTCRSCNHHFCWVCLSDINNHTSCNPVKDDELKKGQARNALERYLHYFTHFKAHQESRKFEEKLRATAIAKMIDLQQQTMYYIDVNHIEQATEVLIECRRIMAYTYVLAFFMQDHNQKALFEYLQIDLESTTEKLSGLLEVPVEDHDRREMINVTALAQRRLKNLLDHEGVCK
eukprot:GFYU01002926.1.p1 GENE.GFYU01002926.1~~GFYU01002926.1.p1  ORF type:complete len:785 (+),score=188.95 GFYU01002926.1:102-2456(+)